MNRAAVGQQIQIEEVTEDRLALYRKVENWSSWLAVSMVDWANNKPKNKDRKPKVGGHQASSVSSSSILTALYLHIKRPADRIAVKPHAAPLFYSLMYLMGQLTREQMENFREFGGLPPYPSQHDMPAIVDYSTSIEGLGACAAIEDAYEAMVQRHQLGREIDAVYHALVGDGELTELQIGGSLYEAGRRRLGNVRWWIDLNRQSLDRVMEDSPGGTTADWAINLFEANGWNVINLRWGRKAEAAFTSYDGELLRRRLEGFNDLQQQALLLMDGDTLRKAILGKLDHDDEQLAGLLQMFDDSSPVDASSIDGLTEFLNHYSNQRLLDVVQDYGGHDLARLIVANRDADSSANKPTAIICHTIKGWRLPDWAAHPENHGALMSSRQLQHYQASLQVGSSEDRLDLPKDSALISFLRDRNNQLFDSSSTTSVDFPKELLPARGELRIPLTGERSTSAAFGSVNTAYLRLPIGERMAFIAPDVGLTTHLGGVIALTGVFDSDPGPDLLQFLRHKKQTVFNWRLSRSGRFHSVAINEGVAALKLFAFGRRKFASENKVQMLPVATIYDVFWKHAYSQLYYALYDHARFLAVGTPSGTSLSRESGTHQSRQTPAIVMGLPNIIYYEPAYAFDVLTIYDWAIRQVVEPHGEAVYLRLTTQELIQPFGKPGDLLLAEHGLNTLPVFSEDEATLARLRRDIIKGAYWLVAPEAGSKDRVAHIFASGSLMEEALRASQVLRDRHQVAARVCNVTSWERLKRDYEAYWSNPDLHTDEGASYHLHDLIPDDEIDVPTVVVGDFAPEVAEWVSGALGRRVPVLAPRSFSRTGSVSEVRKFHGIDSDSIVQKILRELNPPWRVK